MARIAVLDHNQSENEQPRKFVKRSDGQTLVRRALAYWVIKNAILRMLPKHERGHSPPAIFCGSLPPAELPGLRFDDPVKRPAAPRLIFLKSAERQEQFA